MTFDELKTAFLQGARRFEMCDTYHDIVLAADYQELISAGISLLEYAWRSGIVTTDLLDEFPSGLLADNGIYYAFTGTLGDTPPAVPLGYFDSFEIFVLAGSDVIINHTANKKYKVNLLDSHAVINMSNTSFLALKTIRGAADVNLSDTSVACMELRNFTGEVCNITMTDQAQAEVNADSYAVVNMFIDTSTFSKVSAMKSSIVNVNQDENSDYIVATAYEQAIINFNPSL